MAFLDTLIFGVRTILSGGAELTQRSKLNFHGSITAVDNPETGATDVSTGGNDVKASCRVATTVNITLSGAQTIDGVAVIAGNRVLVKAQSAGASNGIYVCAAGPWSRSDDANTSALVTSGMFTFVTEGTANDNTAWQLTTNDPIVLGTTALVFAQVGSGGVTSVSGTAPIVSSGGATPAISITAASGVAAGSMTAADFSKLGLYPAISGLSTGAVLRATGAAATAFGQVDLANVNAVAGILPAGNRAAPTAAEVAAVSTALHLSNNPRVADFATTLNIGFDGFTATDATEGGILFHRDGAVGTLEITARLKPIASGSAWTITAGVTYAGNLPSRNAPSVSQFANGGIALYDGVKVTVFGVDRSPGDVRNLVRINWTNEDLFASQTQTALAAPHPLHVAWIYGGPIYFQLRLRSGTIEYWWSLSGRQNSFVRETSMDVAVGAFLGPITHCGWGQLSNTSPPYPFDVNLGYFQNIS